ncbi:hypothetical protein ACFDTO_21865 [Microbacteriaceae bacterium 4G12]
MADWREVTMNNQKCPQCEDEDINFLKQNQKIDKGLFSIILTLVLFLVALFVFFFFNGRIFPNLSLWIPICLYLLIDIGFIVSIILGVKSKNKGIKVFSILSNIAFMIPLSIWLFLLLLANGISEP